MIDKIYYYDHNNMLKLTLNEYPYVTEPSDFKNWLWEYNDQFGRLNTFRRAKAEWELPIGIQNDSKEKRDELCDIFTADLLANQPGRLVLRDWSLKCYITQAEYEYGHYNTELDRKVLFQVRAVDSTWTRESTRAFSGVPGGSPVLEDLWRDYVNTGEPNRGYDYGYNLVESHDAEIELAGASGNGYRITVYGPAVDPAIYINGHPVRVNVTIESGDRLVIESNGPARSIEILKANGARLNAFNYRDKEYSPFIDLGDDVQLSYGAIRFDFTAIERRSEPTWI